MVHLLGSALCAAFLFLGGFVSSEMIVENDNSSLYKLPRNIWPEHYEIKLLTEVTNGNFKYHGSLELKLRVAESTSSIILHKDKLNVTERSSKLLRVDNDENIRISEESYDPERQFYIFNTSESLQPGQYVLRLSFVGDVLDDLFGFYKSSYRKGNETRWIGVTQFSPVYARRAFPCMDEPVFKATFQLHIGHYENETVNSNTRAKSTLRIGNNPSYFLTTFEKTPKMSTYLVGWVIHDFKKINSLDSRISLWTRFSSEFELEIAPIITEGTKIYASLEKSMPLANPIGKIDLFAIPDFNFNAMENWGLITFRESVGIQDHNVQTPINYLQDSMFTIGHEFAHTWFGNLVTPEFWDCAWLKEGFATYFSYKTLASLFEDWNMMDQFIVQSLQSSMLQDSVDHNRSMNGKRVGSPSSAKAALDFVTYHKAASIIRMVNFVMGEEAFNKAMESYLIDNAYQATTPEVLYKHLDKVQSPNYSKTNFSISEFLKSWAESPGYPVVTVSLSRDKFHLSQQPFRWNRTERNYSKPRKWVIPVTYQTKTGPKSNEIFWFHPNKDRLIISVPPINDGDWILLNLHQVGFYRVNYDKVMWEALIDQLNSKNFDEINQLNRASLLDDAFNLARADYLDYETPLRLYKYLTRETRYVPWLSAVQAIDYLDSKLREDLELRNKFRKYALHVMSNIYRSWSFEEKLADSHETKLLRKLIFSTACSLGHDDCLSNAKSMFQNWIANSNNNNSYSVPANFKSFVYCHAVQEKNYSEENWHYLWTKFLKTESHVEKDVLIGALACTDDTVFLRRLLGTCILAKASNVPKQYTNNIVKRIVDSGRGKNVEEVLKFLEENQEDIVEAQGVTFLEVSIKVAASKVDSKDALQRLKKLFENGRSTNNFDLKIEEEVIKTAENNIAWVEKYSQKIHKSLTLLM